MTQAQQRLSVGLAGLMLLTSFNSAADSDSPPNAVKFPYTLNEADLTDIIAVAAALDLSVASPIDSLETWKHRDPRLYGAKFVFGPFESTDRTSRHYELDCYRDGVESAAWDCVKQEAVQVSVVADQSPDIAVIGDENTNLSEVVDVIDLVYSTSRKFAHPVKVIAVVNGFDVGYFTGRCTEYLPVRWSEGAGKFEVPEVHRVRQECPKRKERKVGVLY
jgi:hypothetical protein